ncbi:hypothetical protein DFJ74DRAFT_754622 [Hyaloraphidium curvatum]|nr:hypothetical protein DFJ74DRAFT_754622 [Hyaloraphidium curvatum]
MPIGGRLGEPTGPVFGGLPFPRPPYKSSCGATNRAKPRDVRRNREPPCANKQSRTAVRDIRRPPLLRTPPTMPDPAAWKPDRAFLVDFARKWADAWNSRDFSLFREILDPEVHFDEQIFWPRVIHGVNAELESYFSRFWAIYPDLKFTIKGHFFGADDASMMVHWVAEATGPAEHGSRRMASDGFDLLAEFRDGKLLRYQGCNDILDMMRQVGQIPERGNMTGGAYVFSLMGKRPRSKNASL